MTVQPEIRIEAGEVSKIIEAAGLEVAAAEPTAGKLRAILAQTVSEMLRNAPTRKPLTRREFEKVERLHDRFDQLLRSYQGTGNPPPMLPVYTLESGKQITTWERWLDSLKLHGGKREESINWAAVGELLVIYEMLFETAVVTENAEFGDSKPVAFLRAAFALVKRGVADERIQIAPWYYMAPGVSSLNARLKDLRANEMRFARNRIDCRLRTLGQ